jgi:L-cysteate sulfo-lyase
MNLIDKKLANVEMQRHAVLPTPIHEAAGLSELSDCRVFVKRDDLTAFGFGGNKARKLDYLIPEAIKAECDTLVTMGGNQSNFCRMVAAYGSVHDMKVHLVLGGNKPDHATGNLKLSQMLGAECHYVGSSDWDEWEVRAKEVEEELKLKGRKVYRMPVGGSTPTGALGYVAAMSEIMDDEKRLGLNFDSIVFASGSAGTQAGLIVGKSIAKWPGQVLGFCVAKQSDELEEAVFTLAQETAENLGASINRHDVCVDDSYFGEGYALNTRECEAAVQFFARKCGIFLDYVYTGKAAAGLLDYLKKGCFKSGSNILFIHTGGNVALFA